MNLKDSLKISSRMGPSRTLQHQYFGRGNYFNAKKNSTFLGKKSPTLAAHLFHFRDLQIDLEGCGWFQMKALSV